MLHPARVLTALVVLVVTLALRHAVPGLEDRPEPDRHVTDAASRHNQPIVEDLTGRWRALPQVVEAQAGYSGATDFGVVTASAVCERCSRRTLMWRLARDIWSSDLSHVTSFKVVVAEDRDRSHPLSQTWNVRRDAATLYDRYGKGLVDPDTVPAG